MCFRKQARDRYQDDGSTIADMNVEGFRWYQNPKLKARQNELKELNVTREERRAMIRGAFAAYLPVFLIIIGSFILAFLLLMALIRR
jgi:hypothetical protein